MCPKCKFKGEVEHELFTNVKRGQICNDCNQYFKKCARCSYIGSHQDPEFLMVDGNYGVNCKECRTKKNKMDRDYKKRKTEEDPEGYINHLNKLSNNLYKKKMQLPEFREKRQKYAKKSRGLHPEYKSANTFIISKYKNRAKKNGLEMSLTDDEIIDLTKGGHLCYYCNQNDTRGYCGIDRVDPSEGYNTENCASCCSMCNYMKDELYLNYFISYCGHVACYNNLLEAPYVYKYMENWYGYDYNKYSGYEKRAKKDNIPFLLNENIFLSIISQDCYICGRKNSKEHENGVDRVDNSKGYTIENSKPCCGRCNYMKKTYDLQSFLTKCATIYNNCKKCFELCSDDDFSPNEDYNIKII